MCTKKIADEDKKILFLLKDSTHCDYIFFKSFTNKLEDVYKIARITLQQFVLKEHTMCFIFRKKFPALAPERLLMMLLY